MVRVPRIRRRSDQPEVSALSDEERDWVSQHVNAAPGFVGELTGEPVAGELTPEQLDAGWAAWISSGNTNPEEVSTVINIFGLAFGQLLVDRLAMEWVVAMDEHGPEVAVLGQPGTQLAYPANMVTKRWEKREVVFFTRLFELFSDVRAP